MHRCTTCRKPYNSRPQCVPCEYRVMSRYGLVGQRLRESARAAGIDVPKGTPGRKPESHVEESPSVLTAGSWCSRGGVQVWVPDLPSVGLVA